MRYDALILNRGISARVVSTTEVTMQVPAYMASNLSTTLDMRETLFTIWTGTNDGESNICLRGAYWSATHALVS